MTLCDPSHESTAESDGRPVTLPDGVPSLTSLYLYLTSACNLRCRHCWVAPTFVDGAPSPSECLDLDLLQRAVTEAKPLGLRHAKLTGGEPLLHPRFVEIVDLLTTAGLSLSMETNGTLIDAALGRYLKDHTNLSFVSVSVDGPNSEVHDSFRGVEGSFDAAVHGFEYLVKAGYRPQLISCLYRGNYRYVEETVDMAVRLGAGSVKFNPVTRTGRAIVLHDRGEALDVEEILGLARFLRGELQRRTPIRLIMNTPLALYTVGELVGKKFDGMCHVRHVLGILGSGEMALCGIGRTIPDLCFGNLGQVSLTEVWRDHPVLCRLRRDLDGTYPGLCSRCIHAKRCLTHCVAQNYQDNGQLVATAWLCKEAYARSMFPTSRLREEQ